MPHPLDSRAFSSRRSALNPDFELNTAGCSLTPPPPPPPPPPLPRSGSQQSKRQERQEEEWQGVLLGRQGQGRRQGWCTVWAEIFGSGEEGHAGALVADVDDAPHPHPAIEIPPFSSLPLSFDVLIHTSNPQHLESKTMFWCKR
jgi:hypothetical protein